MRRVHEHEGQRGQDRRFRGSGSGDQERWTPQERPCWRDTQRYPSVSPQASGARRPWPAPVPPLPALPPDLVPRPASAGRVATVKEKRGDVMARARQLRCEPFDTLPAHLNATASTLEHIITRTGRAPPPSPPCPVPFALCRCSDTIPPPLPVPHPLVQVVQRRRHLAGGSHHHGQVRLARLAARLAQLERAAV